MQNKLSELKKRAATAKGLVALNVIAKELLEYLDWNLAERVANHEILRVLIMEVIDRKIMMSVTRPPEPTPQEHSTILAGLRVLQHDPEMLVSEYGLEDHFLDFPPLDPDEIGDLCEKLNIGEKAYDH